MRTLNSDQARQGGTDVLLVEAADCFIPKNLGEYAEDRADGLSATSYPIEQLLLLMGNQD